MLRFVFYSILSIVIFLLVLATSLSWHILPTLPDVSTLQNIKLQVPLRVYSQDNSLIAEFGEKKRQPVLIDDVPLRIKQAFIATEDAHFYQHHGIDWQGIMRAAINLVKTGSKTQGGSTITMQVARNFFLDREKTYLRKLKEMVLAIKIEQQLTKDEILTLYLTKVFMGHRSYGIVAATQTYYGVELNELSLAQIAMIAALPKAPSSTNPLTNIDKARKRRNYVLKRMFEEKFITKQDYQLASNAPITASLHKSKVTLKADYVAEMVRQKMVEQYGEHAYTSGLKVITTIKDKNQIAAEHALQKALSNYDVRHGYRDPEYWYNLKFGDNKAVWEDALKSFRSVGNLQPAIIVKIHDQSITVYSSGIGLVHIEWSNLSWAKPYISHNRQGARPKSTKDFLQLGDIIRIKENDNGVWELTQLPEVQGAFVSMNPNNGATLALMGGSHFQISKFNRATQARRQIGSGFKPFLYSAGLASGKTAATVINDAPMIFEGKDVGLPWRPENYGNKNYGPTRLREALIHSRNLVSVRLMHEIGIPATLKHIEKFGFDISKLPNNLSLSLGSASLTPWEMAEYFCVFANGGYKVEPYFIDSILNNTGEVLYKANPPYVCHTCIQQPKQQLHKQTKQQQHGPYIAERVVDARNIWIINSMTQDVIKYGTGRKALTLGRQDLSGKTGTTNEQRDAWFYGYNADVIAVTWIGFDQYHTLGNKETGARVALPAWIDYMKVLANMPERILPKPDGLTHVRIKKDTGELAHSDDINTIYEVFRTEYSPTAQHNDTQTNVLNKGITDPTFSDLF